MRPTFSPWAWLRRAQGLTAALVLLVVVLCTGGVAQASDLRMLEEDDASTLSSHGGANVSTRSLERRHLAEARKYRAQGRLELARQSYLLALSVCTNEGRLDVIRQELGGVELMLRTMR